MNLRLFKTSDTPLLIDLFRDTIHQVCKKDYSPEQLNAWAPTIIDSSLWNERLLNSYCLISEIDGGITGFGSLKSDGCIDMFYIHANWQKKGVGSIIFNGLEQQATIMGLSSLHSDVSITARPFFKKQGFEIEKIYSKELRGIIFENAIMRKQLK